MSNEQVLGVLINWKRPANIPRIIAAMRAQTVCLHISIMECALSPEFRLSDEVRAMADSVFTMNFNSGPVARFIPPLLMPQFKYTYFGVDDHEPGPRHVEWLLQTAVRLDDQFATIGQDGRLIRDGQIVKQKGRMHGVHPTPTDVVTSSELCLTRWLPHVMLWRAEFLATIGRDCSTFEDDLFLCFGAQNAASNAHNRPVPSYLTPQPPTGDESWRVRKLAAPNALCGRPGHDDMRNHFIHCAQQFGWSSKSEAIESGKNA